MLEKTKFRKQTDQLVNVPLFTNEREKYKIQIFVTSQIK